MLKKLSLITLFTALICFIPAPVYAEEIETSLAGSIGWMTLIPPIIAIILAFITKNVILSLFVGIF